MPETTHLTESVIDLTINWSAWQWIGAVFAALLMLAFLLGLSGFAIAVFEGWRSPRLMGQPSPSEIHPIMAPSEQAGDEGERGCPFCASPIVSYRSTSEWEGAMSCHTCGACGPTSLHGERAASILWAQRAPSS